MCDRRAQRRLEVTSLNSNGKPTRLQLLRRMIENRGGANTFVVLQDTRTGDSRKINFKGYKAITEGDDGKVGGVAILIPKGTTMERLKTTTREAVAVKIR